MLYKTSPDDFNSKFEIVSCFVRKGDELLFLHRQDHKPQGNTWGIPAGKVDSGEVLLDAIHRELKEETGIDIAQDRFIYIDKVYTRYPGLDFIFHMYRVDVPENTEVTISTREHKSFQWIKPEEANRLELMEDIEDCMKIYLD